MPDRMLREGLIASRRWAGLKLHLQNLFVRLILAADDYGTFPANPALIRSRCYPLELERAREADLQRWLEELEKAGLVRFHWHRDDRYLTLERFRQVERMKYPRARYPRLESDGETPNASGQVAMPFAEAGPPGEPPAGPHPGNFSAPKALKRREEKSPHSPPTTGGGKLLKNDGDEPRPPRRFRTPERRAARSAEIDREIARIRERMRDLYHPGGCAYKVEPSGANAAMAQDLKAQWEALEKEQTKLKMPENTGGEDHE